MRPVLLTLVAGRALCVAACLCAAAASGQDAGIPLRADPLEVPRGRGPEPEDVAQQSLLERIRAAASARAERGDDESPLLAWALLDEARRQAKPEFVAEAVALAPSSPGVRFAAALRAHSVPDLVASLVALAPNFPGALWCLALLGGLVLGGAVALGAVVAVVVATRGLPLHGHGLGHLTDDRDPSLWPGLLLCVTGVALLALFGLGPVGLLAVAGALAAPRVRPREARMLVVALALTGVALGPGLDRLAPALLSVGRDAELLAAWRVEHGEALQRDVERLERACALAPEDPLLRLVLAGEWLRRGELGRAGEVLGEPTGQATPALRAAMLNLRGILQLAAGQLGEAIPAFERARSTQESAAVLFNLSQAYGRALRLSDQQPTFEAARRLDDELVSRTASREGSNVHHYLLRSQLDARLFLARALVRSAETEQFARALRARLLGRGPLADLWWALPAVALAGALLRRKRIARCSRCERPICDSCSREARISGTCQKCVRLFAQAEKIDARLRREQLELDRRRQRHRTTGLALASLFAPGAPELYEGKLLSGSLRIFALGAGAASLYAAASLPSPWEIGALGTVLPVVVGFALAAPVLLGGVAGALGRLGQIRRTA